MNFLFLNREVPSLHAAALILGGAAFLSKLLGLLRDRLLAARFGAGETLDTYYAAFQVPDALFAVLLIGAASAAVLPVFLGEERKSRAAAEAFLSNLLTIFAIGSVVAVLLAELSLPILVPIVAPGFGAEQLGSTITLTRIMLLNVVFLGAAGIVASVLQAHRRFFVFALPPICYNLGIIVGILVLEPLFGVRGLAWGVVLGGGLQVLIQLPALASLGFRLRPRFDLSNPAFRHVIRISLPRVVALSLGQGTLIVLAAIASYFAAGSITTFRLAANLIYVPVGLFGVSYALAIFPKLSGAKLERAGERFREDVTIGIRNILFWALPFAALAIVLRAHVVRVVLGSGAFDWEDTRLVAAIVALLAVAIVSESLLPLILRAFYALDRTRESLLWAIVGAALTVFLAIGFSALAAAAPEALAALAAILRVGDLAAPKVLAIAAAFALGSFVNVWLLARSLRLVAERDLGITLAFGGRALLGFLAAAITAGLAAYLTLLPFPALIATNTFAGIALQGMTAGAVGLAVYGVLLRLQRNPEVLGLIASVRGRLLTPRRTPEVYEAEKLDGEGIK